jgi:hypothetical protein
LAEKVVTERVAADGFKNPDSARFAFKFSSSQFFLSEKGFPCARNQWNNANKSPISSRQAIGFPFETTDEYAFPENLQEGCQILYCWPADVVFDSLLLHKQDKFS